MMKTIVVISYSLSVAIILYAIAGLIVKIANLDIFLLQMNLIEIITAFLLGCAQFIMSIRWKNEWKGGKDNEQDKD